MLFDVNAVWNLFRPRRLDMSVLPDVRAKTLECVRRGRLRVVVTQPLLWELTAIIDATEHGGFEQYVEAIEFCSSASAGRFLHHEYARKRLEIRKRQPLSDQEAFYDINPGELVRMCATKDWIATQQAQLHENKTKERENEGAARQRTVAGLNEKVGAEWRDRLVDDLSPDRWHATVRGMTRTEMRRFAQSQRMRIKGPQWPWPDKVPTFWYGESFLMSKALSVFIDHKGPLDSKRSIQRMPGVLDATHFRDCAYADVLVTDDGKFAEVAKRARTSVQVIGLAAFAEELAAA